MSGVAGWKAVDDGWQAVDGFIADRLLPEDPVLTECLERCSAAGQRLARENDGLRGP